MNDALMDNAHSIAREELKSVHLAICKRLDAHFADGDLDPICRAAVRGQKLWLAAIEFAEKVWAGSLPYGKALYFLLTQFTDFPPATCERALGEAYRRTAEKFIQISFYFRNNFTLAGNCFRHGSDNDWNHSTGIS